jgi:hypothetical protein
MINEDLGALWKGGEILIKMGSVLVSDRDEDLEFLVQLSQQAYEVVEVSSHVKGQ